jgi:hypothetical protein
MKAIVHVNRQHLSMNAKDGGQRPVYIVRQDGKVTYGQAVRIKGTVELVDPRSHSQLSCGARAWIEVIDGDVDITEPCSFQEARDYGQAEY